MGYMGFGMRKEVYKRKPKKPFLRIKKNQKVASSTSNKPKYNASKEYQNIRFKSLRDRKWFKVFLLILSLATVVYFVILFVVLPYQFEKGKREFETVDVITQYEDSGYKELISFFESRRDILESVQRAWYAGGLEVWIKSPDYQKDDQFGETYFDISDADSVRILNGALITYTSKGMITRKSNWRTFFRVKNTKTINTDMLNYLTTTREEFGSILKQVHREDLNIGNTGAKTVLSFKNFYDTYSILYSPKTDSALQIILKLDKTTFLTSRYWY